MDEYVVSEILTVPVVVNGETIMFDIELIVNASLLNEYYLLDHPIWIWDTETNEWNSINKNN